jgi:hypothetical protein
MTNRHDELMRAAFSPVRGLDPNDAEVAAVLGRVETPARRAVAGRAGWGARRVIAVGAASLALAGTAMAATGVWNPEIGTEAPDSGPPTLSESAVSPAVTEVLGALRREPTDQDRGPEVEATLRTLGKSFGFAHTSDPELGEFLSYFEYGVKGVRPDSVRYLAPAVDDKATILFSVEDAGFSSLVGDPKSGENSENLFLDGQGLCIYKPVGPGTPLERLGEPFPLCWTLDEVLAGRAFWYTELSTEPAGGGFGLVPDGVASVTVRLQSGAEVEAPVTHNYFQFTLYDDQVGPYGLHWEGRPEFIWHDAGGAVVQPQAEHHSG